MEKQTALLCKLPVHKCYLYGWRIDCDIPNYVPSRLHPASYYIHHGNILTSHGAHEYQGKGMGMAGAQGHSWVTSPFL